MPFVNKGKGLKSVYQTMTIIKKAWHFQALDDYLMGMKLTEIAVKYNKSVVTINSLFHSPAFLGAINKKTADLEAIFSELVPVMKKTITSLLQDEKVDPETKASLIFKILDRIGMPAVDKKTIESTGGPLVNIEDNRVQTAIQNLDPKKANLISKVLKALDDTITVPAIEKLEEVKNDDGIPF